MGPSPAISNSCSGYNDDICKTLPQTDLSLDPTLGTPLPTLKKAVSENIGMNFKVIDSFSMAVFPFSRFSGLPMRYSWQNDGYKK